jgi:hypothetical protein
MFASLGRTRKAAAFGELGQPGLLKISLLSCELIEKVCTDLFYSRHYYAPLRSPALRIQAKKNEVSSPFAEHTAPLIMKQFSQSVYLN